MANPVINELITSVGLNTITVPLPLVLKVTSNVSNVQHNEHFPISSLPHSEKSHGTHNSTNTATGSWSRSNSLHVSGSGYKLILLANSSTTTTRSSILRQLVSQFLPDAWIDLKAQLNGIQSSQITNSIGTSGIANNSNLTISSNVTSSAAGASSMATSYQSNEDGEEDDISPYSISSSSLSSTPTSVSPSESIDGEADPTDSILIDTQSRDLHIVDLNNALRYSLYQEVLLHSDIDSDKMVTIKKFFALVSRFYPFTNENIRRFIRRMSQWSNLRNSSNADSLHAIMRAGSEGFLPPIQNYVSCRGSKREFRGYPCAFWLLFHTLTVSEYKSMVRRNVTHHEVLPLMKSYVKDFFTCKSCAAHFDSLTYNLTTQLPYKNSSVLLLWQIHNVVNERTAGSASEDPYFPKVPFPTSQECPKCRFDRSKRKSDENATNGVSSDDWQVNWNLDEVFSFLTTRYDRTRIIRKTFPFASRNPSSSSSSSSSSSPSLASYSFLNLVNQITLSALMANLLM